MFKFRWLALPCAVAVVSACGGGGFGQETLYVSVSYAQTTMSLYTVSTIQPTLSGFDGHDPRCDQSGGVLPVGVHINNDCTISGRPTEAGSFSLGYKVRAENAEGSFNSSTTVYVVAPTVIYPGAGGSVRVGSAVNVGPSTAGSGWVAPSDAGLSWSYSLASGALPPGLALNPTTGVIAGNASTAGTYAASVQSVLTTSYGVYRPAATRFALTVN